MPDALHITKLTVRNFKGVVNVSVVPAEVSPDGRIVEISGRNGQGKSSVLDAVVAALDAAAIKKVTPKVVRDGASEAWIEAKLSDGLTIKRRFRTDNSYDLLVENDDLSRPRRPQELIDSLKGQIAFDAFAFGSLKPKDQRETLLGLIELPFDPDEIEREIAQVREDRLLNGRVVKQLAGQLAGMPEPEPGLPTEPVAMSELARELTAAQTVVAENARKREFVTTLDSRVDQATERVERLRGELRAAEEDLAALIDRMDAAVVEAAGLEDPDVDAIAERMESIEEVNAAIRAAAERAAVADQLHEVEEAAAGFERRLRELETTKQEGILGANMPIEGLGFSEDGVLYRGVPLDQCSSSERMRVGLAIYMALNPKLKVVLVRDASLLDSDAMTELIATVEEHDFQVWLEIVDDSGHGVGVVIEDGLVATEAGS